MKRKHNNAIRRAVLFGCLIGAVLLTACGKEQKKDVSSITIDDLIAANTREALLGKYDVVRVKRTIDGEEEADRYYTKDDYYDDIAKMETEDPGIYFMKYLNQHGESYRYYYDADGTVQLAYEWYAMSEDEAKTEKWDASSADIIISKEATKQEKIMSVADNEDGTLTIMTELGLDGLQMAMGEVDEDWEKLQIVYVLDAETLEIRSMDETICLTDGSEGMTFHLEMETNVKEPEAMGQMIDEDPKQQKDTTENPRSITVIYDPGTEEEYEISLTIDCAYKAMPYVRAGYEMYLDPDGKEPYTGGDGLSDLTMYGLKQ